MSGFSLDDTLGKGFEYGSVVDHFDVRGSGRLTDSSVERRIVKPVSMDITAIEIREERVSCSAELAKGSCGVHVIEVVLDPMVDTRYVVTPNRLDRNADADAGGVVDDLR